MILAMQKQLFHGIANLCRQGGRFTLFKKLNKIHRPNPQKLTNPQILGWVRQVD